MEAQAAAPEVSKFAPKIGKTPAAWKMLIFGNAGIGKSTLATYAPKPYFLDLEGGLDRVDCHRTPERLTTLEDVIDALRWFLQSDYQTVVVDTLDELEKLLAQKVCRREGKETLVDIAYGKGVELLINEWRAIIDVFEKVRARGKNIILVGHEKIEKFENPTAENYDRYQLNVHKKTAPIITAKMDAVLFARQEVFTTKKEDKRTNKAVGGERVIHTQESPTWIAKNRFGLPETMPMDKSLFDKIS